MRRRQVPLNDPLCNGWGMCPTKRQGQEGVGVPRGPNPNAANIRLRQAYRPEAVGKVENGNTRGC